MANSRGQHIDKTHLSLDTAEERGFIHRDYIAHCLRWSHVVKKLTEGQAYQTACILDVGCGKEVPLAKTLYSSRLIVQEYVGVDVNKMVRPAAFHTGKFPLTVVGQCDFAQQLEVINGALYRLKCDDGSFIRPTHVVSFEVLEHVEPEHMIRLLAAMHKVGRADTQYFISTPCFNGKAANNHVNEVTYEALGSTLEAMGFAVVQAYGTFASIRDYQDEIKNVGAEAAFNYLRSYYDVNYLATIFAPMFPHLSRNCLWHLEKAQPEYMFKFGALEDCKTPWTSSTRWKELAEAIKEHSQR